MAAAATRWDLGPGAGPRADSSHLTKTIAALQNLEALLPRLSARLQSKEQLDERQRVLAQQGGSIEATGGPGEQAHFRVRERIGEGTFCVVFRGDLFLDKPGEGKTRPVALKFELKKTDSTQLRNEYRMYKKFGSCPGIPTIYTLGDMNFHKVLLMDLLGPSLETVLHSCNRRFSTKTVAMLAKQMIARMQTIHDNGIIYRDIKPENFLISSAATGDTSTIYLVDFGMAKLYRDPETKEHIAYGEAQSLSGTARYMSINAHCRRSQSRRDDLEALGHVFMYFLRGSLPWQGIKATPADQRYEIMCEKKQSISIEDLCQGFPHEFAEYLAYARGLPFDADPDYAYLQGLFDRVLADLGETDDGRYDWLGPNSSLRRAPRPPIAHAEALAEALTDGANMDMAAHAPLPAPLAAPAEIMESDGVTPPQGKSKESTPPVPSVDMSPALSPPGKRSRSEFASDLRPPVRVRPKKTTFSFYDYETQKSLLALHREIMAKRYVFHRSVGGSTRPSPSTAAVAAAAAAVAATSSIGGAALMSSFRQRGPLRGTSHSLVSPAFIETLDKTLALINSELEDMSDKLLQGGDWMGCTRVKNWFEKILLAAQRENQRLQTMKDQGLSDTDAGMVETRPPTLLRFLQDLPPAEPDDTADNNGTSPSGRIVVDVEEMVRKDQALRNTAGSPIASPQQGQGKNTIEEGVPDVAQDGEIQPRRSGKERSQTFGSVASTDARPPQPNMESLTLGVDPAATTDHATQKEKPAAGTGGEDTDEDDDNEFALVYRTASGTQKVLRVAENPEAQE